VPLDNLHKNICTITGNMNYIGLYGWQYFDIDDASKQLPQRYCFFTAHADDFFLKRDLIG
jgi:hypothetical protein